jgi:hypothetical protein
MVDTNQKVMEIHLFCIKIMDYYLEYLPKR